MPTTVKKVEKADEVSLGQVLQSLECQLQLARNNLSGKAREIEVDRLLMLKSLITEDIPQKLLQQFYQMLHAELN